MEKFRFQAFSDQAHSSLRSNAIFLYQHVFFLSLSFKFFTAKIYIRNAIYLKVHPNKCSHELKSMIECECMNE